MLTLMAALWGGVAHAGDIREPLMELLNAYEHGATPEDLAKLGEGVPAELVAIASDPEVPHSRRGRAVSALGGFKSPDVRGFLERTLAGDDALLRRKASYSLARAHGDDALPVLRTALESDDSRLRTATVHALASIGSAASRSALRDHLDVEQDDQVKLALTKVLEGQR